jgi:peptidyl-prolyl cis-trans isomerase SurA
MKDFRLLLALTCVLISPVSFAQNMELSDTGEMLDSIAAVVNDGIVLTSELQIEVQRIVARLEAEGTPIPPMNQLAPQILERLVIRQIQLQRAARIGLQISDENLNLALAGIAERNGVSLNDLPAMLAQEGIDYASYRAEMRDQLIVEQLRQRDVIGSINVTQRELEDYLERQEGRATRNVEFKLSQILISTSANADPENVATSEKQVWEIYEKVQNGASFAEMAIAFSDGQQALEGGEMGWRKGEELPTLFADIVPGLERGQVSEPIRSASGFHLVRLNDIRGADPIMESQTRARHILITVNEILDEEAARQRLTEIREQIMDGDDFEAVAKVVSEDPGSAINGGDLGWNGPDIFVPEFQVVCDQLEIDEISDPFRSSFGWHIIQLLDRRVQDTTDQVMRQEALMAIRNSKLNEETELWARRLRDQAFVEYRL